MGDIYRPSYTAPREVALHDSKISMQSSHYVNDAAAEARHCSCYAATGNLQWHTNTQLACL